MSLIKEEADIIFANEEEIKSLLGTSDLDESINIIKDKNKIFAITLGENGAMIINNEEIIKIEPQKIDNLVDTTGAGDLFAAGFLLKYIQGQPLEELSLIHISEPTRPY